MKISKSFKPPFRVKIFDQISPERHILGLNENPSSPLPLGAPAGGAQQAKLEALRQVIQVGRGFVGFHLFGRCQNGHIF